jgi:hypothetical protein
VTDQRKCRGQPTDAAPNDCDLHGPYSEAKIYASSWAYELLGKAEPSLFLSYFAFGETPSSFPRRRLKVAD